MDTNNEKIPNYREVTVSVSMSKSIMVEIPEDASDEELLEKAKREVMLPSAVMDACRKVFRQLGVKVNGIDFNDWCIDEVEFIPE